MKRSILILASLIFLTQLCQGQNDSIKIFGRKTLVPGVYTSYEEFAQNAPSIREGFTVTRLINSKDDSIVVAAYYTLNDSFKKKTILVWGVCDGAFCYVKQPDIRGYLSKKTILWKLECVGPYSYFTVITKPVVFAGPGAVQLITAALTLSSSPRVDGYVITPEGKIKYADVLSTEKYLASQPVLLEAFQKLAERYVPYDYGTTLELETDEMHAAEFALVKEYLLKLNRALTEGTRKND